MDWISYGVVYACGAVALYIWCIAIPRDTRNHHRRMIRIQKDYLDSMYAISPERFRKRFGYQSVTYALQAWVLEQHYPIKRLHEVLAEEGADRES